MRYFRILDQDGESYVMLEDRVPNVAEGYPAPLEVDRMPEAFERWDDDAGAFVLDREAQIDEQHGAAAVARAHALKTLEAAMILAGTPVDGLLAAEALATGQTLEELAATVAARAGEFQAAEVARIVAKREARAP